jgi:dTDP-L-rhamnose 4-epimerase
VAWYASGVRTLVTGGAGFIGQHLVRRLVARGEDVVVLDRLEGQVHHGLVPSFPSGVDLRIGDVGDPGLVARALEGTDRVVHLAAAVGVGQSMYRIAHYVRSNALATAVLLEELATRTDRPSRLVVASSMSLYGEGEYECDEHGTVASPPRAPAQLAAQRWECLCLACGRELKPVATSETKPLAPASVYAVTKRDHEELCLAVGNAYDIPTVALRFFNVYGPGQALSNPYTGAVAIFASRILNGRAPIVYEDGRQTRDFVHVSDVVEAIVLALDSDCADAVLNVGTGRAVTISEVAELVAGALASDVTPKITGQFRVGDIRHCYADPAQAAERLGFRARVELAAGVEGMREWLRRQAPVDRSDSAARELGEHDLVR